MQSAYQDSAWHIRRVRTGCYSFSLGKPCTPGPKPGSEVLHLLKGSGKGTSKEKRGVIVSQRPPLLMGTQNQEAWT